MLKIVFILSTFINNNLFVKLDQRLRFFIINVINIQNIVFIIYFVKIPNNFMITSLKYLFYIFFILFHTIVLDFLLHQYKIIHHQKFMFL